MVKRNVFKLKELSLNMLNLFEVPQDSVSWPMYPLGSKWRHHGIDYHIYVNDTQLIYIIDRNTLNLALYYTLYTSN